jgi:Leucine-rich repeat (LRR) protein
MILGIWKIWIVCEICKFFLSKNEKHYVIHDKIYKMSCYEAPQYILDEIEKVKKGQAFITAYFLPSAKVPDALFSLVNFKNFKYLKISYNKLISLPERLFEFTNLEELSLRGNELTTLPSSIGKITNILTL